MTVYCKQGDLISFIWQVLFILSNLYFWSNWYTHASFPNEKHAANVQKETVEVKLWRFISSCLNVYVETENGNNKSSILLLITDYL